MCKDDGGPCQSMYIFTFIGSNINKIILKNDLAFDQNHTDEHACISI